MVCRHVADGTLVCTVHVGCVYFTCALFALHIVCCVVGLSYQDWLQTQILGIVCGKDFSCSQQFSCSLVNLYGNLYLYSKVCHTNSNFRGHLLFLDTSITPSRQAPISSAFPVNVAAPAQNATSSPKRRLDHIVLTSRPYRSGYVAGPP